MIRGAKVRHKIAYMVLLLVIVPILGGCEITPDDKWPVIVTYATPDGVICTLKIEETLRIPYIEYTLPELIVETDVRTYHSTQDFTVKIWQTEISQTMTLYEKGLPVGTVCVVMPTDLRYEYDHVKGEYISGDPPQGIVRLKLCLGDFPVPGSVTDWVDYELVEEVGLVLESITYQYVYHYRYMLEDAEGRTDTFTFSITIDLKFG